MRRIWCLALLLAACIPAVENGADVGGGAVSPPELGSTLNVRMTGDSVHFELHVTNVTQARLGLEFASAQRHDFEVLTAAGARVWRWSDEYMFAQVMGREEFAPGESRVFRGAWAPGAQTGEFTAVGRLVATNLPVELRTAVRLPGR